MADSGPLSFPEPPSLPASISLDHQPLSLPAPVSIDYQTVSPCTCLFRSSTTVSPCTYLFIYQTCKLKWDMSWNQAPQTTTRIHKVPLNTRAHTHTHIHTHTHTPLPPYPPPFHMHTPPTDLSSVVVGQFGYFSNNNPSHKFRLSQLGYMTKVKLLQALKFVQLIKGGPLQKRTVLCSAS